MQQAHEDLVRLRELKFVTQLFARIAHPELTVEVNAVDRRALTSMFSGTARGVAFLSRLFS